MIVCFEVVWSIVLVLVIMVVLGDFCVVSVGLEMVVEVVSVVVSRVSDCFMLDFC